MTATSAELNAFVERVVARLPHGDPDRSRIELDLRSHIADRLEHGQSTDDVLRALGDPERLAGSYLAEVPLVAVSFGTRAVAKLADVVVLALMLLPIGLVVGWFLNNLVVGLGVDAAGTWLLFGVYTALAEWQYSRTLGKSWLGLRVVDESGAKISLGQAAVRQLPVILQVFWIDVFFALFTERHQRAFELLSKTRVVRGTA